jgi:hypothetical protein
LAFGGDPRALARLPGFRREQTARGIFGDPKARVITLKRRSINGLRLLWSPQMGWYDRKVRCVRDLSCGDTQVFLELVRTARRTGIPPRDADDFPVSRVRHGRRRDELPRQGY